MLFLIEKDLVETTFLATEAFQSWGWEQNKLTPLHSSWVCIRIMGLNSVEHPTNRPTKSFSTKRITFHQIVSEWDFVVFFIKVSHYLLATHPFIWITQVFRWTLQINSNFSTSRIYGLVLSIEVITPYHVFEYRIEQILPDFSIEYCDI